MTALRSLVTPVAGALVALLLWDTFVVYPIKIFVVFLHEISHGLAAIATGGEIARIELSFDEGGACVTHGSRFLILSAGYLGSLVWGAVLLVVGARSRYDRVVVGALGVFTLLVTLVYVRSIFGVAYGTAAAGALLLAARFLPDAFSDGLLKVVGIVSCFYAVRDIASDVLLRSIPGSDAHALAELTRVPAVAWGAIWIAAACAVTAVSLSIAARAAR